MQFRSAIDEFLQFCAVERQLSENTLQAYACDLMGFYKWLPLRTPLSEVSTDTLKTYLESLVARRKLAASSIRRHFASLRGFFRRQAERGHGADPFSGWKLKLPRRKRLPRALSRHEISSLLAALRERPSHEHHGDAVLRMAVRLMVATGVRVGELCRLQIEDISPDGASLRIHGKGSRDRVAYITDTAFRAELRQLMQLRRRLAGAAAPLFVNRHGSTMKPQSIRLKLHRLAGDAGLARRITPHMLRHTAATLLIESGVDIRIVQRLLGHSSIATTEIYTHVSDEALRTTLERANVLGTLATR
jgi:site-specific recombinase XerD